MNLTKVFLFTASVFFLQVETQAQAYFQNYTEPDNAFDLHAVAQLQGNQIAVGGQLTAPATGQKKAAVFLYNDVGVLLQARQFDRASIIDLAPAPDGKLLAVVRDETANGLYGISKIDLNGNPEWSRFFSSNSNAVILRTLSTNNGYVLTGSSNNGAALIKKTDLTGIETWSTTISLPGASISLYQAWENSQGGIYVTGSLLQNGFTDGVVLKFSATGNLDWSRRYGTSENDALFHIVPTSDQHIIAGGYTFGANNYGKGWLLKLDPDGLVKWSRTYGNFGIDVSIRSLRPYPGGAVFSISEDGNTPTLGAGIGRVNTSGDLLWVKNYSQTGSVGLNPKLAIAKNDDLLLAATLQTGSGRGGLLARANDKGDTPPCCLRSFNLTVLDLLTTNLVFVPSTGGAPALMTTTWTATAINPITRGLCIAPNLDFTLSDTVLCPGACIDWEIISPTPGSTYTWSYPGGVADTTNPNRICYPSLNANATITLTADACSYSKKQQIIHLLSGKDQYPNAFTPDGDHVNDTFLPLLPCSAPGLHFSIYNRWGSLVFETSDSGKGWDGTVNGEDAPSDVYIWMLQTQTNQGLIQRKGNVTLIR